MSKRGRPPHPGILTDRELEVLRLIRQGMSNPEIGDRLSIARETVKWHVSEILSKLGVETREEAAALVLGEAPGDGFRARFGGVPLLLRIASGGFIAATVAAVALLGFSVLQADSSGSESEPRTLFASNSATPVRRGSATATATPRPSVVVPTPTPGIATTQPTQQAAGQGPESTPTPSPQQATPPTPEPTPTVTPVLTATPSPAPTNFDCGFDLDCDGVTDEVEVRYGTDPLRFRSHPEGASFDAEFAWDTCSNEWDDDDDGLEDLADPDCASDL